MEEQNDKKEWYAVRTRPKSEKWVVRQLTEAGIEAWIPLKWSVRKYPGRVRKTQVPLILGYVFVRLERKKFALVLGAEGVFDFVRFGREIPIVPAEQLDLLKFITGENVHIEVTDSPLEKGDKVEIIGGELTGIGGELVEFKGKHRVLLRLENVGLSFLFEVPKESLRKLV